MAWWNRSVTFLLDPFSDGEPYRLSLPWWLALTAGGLAGLAFLIVLGGLILGGSKVLLHDGELITAQDVTELRQVREEQRRRLNRMSSLEEKLERNRRKQEQLLRLVGFDHLSLPSEPSNGFDRVDAGGDRFLDRTLDGAIERNRELERIRKFVDSRSELLEHTPTLWPTEGWLSSSYGYRHDPMGGSGGDYHRGIDIAAWHGSPVRAPAEGNVVQVGRNGGYGLTIEIEHRYGYSTLYAHMSESLVEVGDRVSKGALIGRVGQSGRSTGSHLHYEIRVNGDNIDPSPYLIEQYDFHTNYE